MEIPENNLGIEKESGEEQPVHGDSLRPSSVYHCFTYGIYYYVFCMYVCVCLRREPDDDFAMLLLKRVSLSLSPFSPMAP